LRKIVKLSSFPLASGGWESALKPRTTTVKISKYAQKIAAINS